MESQRIIQVEEKVPLKLLVPLSIQHMFAMFGASILVPFIFGINPVLAPCCLFLLRRERLLPIWAPALRFWLRLVLSSAISDTHTRWEALWQWGFAAVFWRWLSTGLEQAGSILYCLLLPWGPL